MDVDDFKASLAKAAPPDGAGPALQALWYEAKGDWRRAHHLAQSQADETGAWVHAYLHRVEGDESNADHWYRRAGKPRSSATLAEEWAEIVAAL
ncbi:MAG: hypothetical protein VCB77_08330 [Alphaproteobacteria bacterium]